MSDNSRQIPGWLLPVGLAVLVTALVTIALLRGPVDLDPDSPEGTVQEYLRAIDEERWDDAVAVIQEDWRGECEGADLARYAQGEFTAELGSSNGFGGQFAGSGFVEGDDAGPELPPSDTTVDVTISHRDNAGLGGGWDEYVVFELADSDDFWWIVNDPWPYFTWDCRG